MTKTSLGHSIVVGVVFILATPVWADFQAGIEAYERGDYDTALGEWRPLAEQGDAQAQFTLGEMYGMGHGVAQDYGETVRWFRLAAEQGYTPARFFLGTMYELGQGVAKDYQEAVQWYRLTADQGYAQAQFFLAIRYCSGEGMSKDDVLAHMWATLAAGQGHEEAVKLRDTLESLMLPAQLAQAQRLAREWKAKGK